MIAAASLRLAFGRCGANPQHAVETLDTVVGRLPRRFIRAAFPAPKIGAPKVTPFRAISARET
ncbi:MAG: hypothetical protein DMG30_05360 [Acidobacteria bacterium]|nr:MAG: hypothetical protein DMG30_05360 [Acidobacteriota bacterium]